MTYLLDSSVFIEAKRQYYDFAFCPGFWNWIKEGFGKGIVHSIVHVKNELLVQRDWLSSWAEEMDDGFFLSPEAKDSPSLSKISEWATHHAAYTDAAKNEFLSVADFFLVAMAHSREGMVVTREIWRNQSKRIPIPNACTENNIPCLNPFDMLRREKVRLILAHETRAD